MYHIEISFSDFKAKAIMSQRFYRFSELLRDFYYVSINMFIGFTYLLIYWYPSKSCKIIFKPIYPKLFLQNEQINKRRENLTSNSMQSLTRVSMLYGLFHLLLLILSYFFFLGGGGGAHFWQKILLLFHGDLQTSLLSMI